MNHENYRIYDCLEPRTKHWIETLAARDGARFPKVVSLDRMTFEERDALIKYLRAQLSEAYALDLVQAMNLDAADALAKL
jgi:hypothetical protein